MQYRKVYIHRGKSVHLSRGSVPLSRGGVRLIPPYIIHCKNGILKNKADSIQFFKKIILIVNNNIVDDKYTFLNTLIIKFKNIKFNKLIFITNLFINRNFYHRIMMQNNTTFAVNKYLCYTYNIVTNFWYNNVEFKNLFIDSKIINRLINKSN